MSKSKWPRIKWNQANAKLANEPFENIFDPPAKGIHTMNGHSEQYEDGYKAAVAGDSPDTNPYALKGSIRRWEAGYKAGMIERNRYASEYREIKALLDPFDVGRVPIVEMVKALMVDDATTKEKAAAWDKLQADIAAGVIVLEMPRGDEEDQPGGSFEANQGPGGMYSTRSSSSGPWHSGPIENPKR